MRPAPATPVEFKILAHNGGSPGSARDLGVRLRPGGFRDRADRQLAVLHSTLETLAERPGLGTGRDWLPRDVLAFPKDGYVIAYRRAGDGIHVLRVTGSEADLLTVD